MLTIPQIKKADQPLVMITCYTAPMARIMDGLVDLFLVGDTLGMMIYGMDNTLGVSLDMMINHGRAVVRANEKTATIVDLPFGSYEASPAHAFQSASRVMKETGCLGVKLEGGAHMVPTVKFLTQRGTPVMGHIGLTPQAVQNLGGYKVQGKTAADHETLLQDAKDLEQAGAFAIVLECIPEALAAEITGSLSIPTIGIGASPSCNGQVMVSDDLLGLFTDFQPKFVRRYENLHDSIKDAVKRYADDVRSRNFPSSDECYA